jgi:hypothetical protein
MSTYAWGSHEVFDSGNRGVLGIGTGARPSTPVVTDLPVGVVLQQVRTSSSATAFLSTTGDVYTSGYNDGTLGVLGIGTTDASTHQSPVLITGVSGVVQVATSRNQTFALTSTGDLYGWGINARGGLGLGHGSPVLSPTLVRTGVAKVATTDRYSLVIDVDGSVHAAGVNSLGQLGVGSLGGPDGSADSYFSWTSTATGESVFDIWCTTNASWLILNDGTVKATGRDGPGSSFGMLGYTISNAGGLVSSWTSIPHLSNIVQVAAYPDQCAWYLDTAGDIWFYGRNLSVGNSGTGSTTVYLRGTGSSDTPDLVLMPVPAGSLVWSSEPGSGTFSPSCGAVGTDHLYYTWGFGASGGTTGFFGGSGSDPTANPVPVSINGLTGVAYAQQGASCSFVIADLTFGTTAAARMWAGVIG